MPLSNCGPGEAEIVRQFRKTAATAPYDGKPGHEACLPQVSAYRKPNCLPHKNTGYGSLGPMELGHKVKAARTEASLSQRGLAKLLKVSHGLVGQWESHVKSPGRDNLIGLARATGQPLSYFIEDIAPDPAILDAKGDEIELVKLYRRMSAKQRRTHLALFRQSVSIRAGGEP